MIAYNPPPNKKTAKPIAIIGTIRLDGVELVSVRYNLFKENERLETLLFTFFDIWVFSA